ncbi:ABC superfamily ATP binding cassette transporter, binding protein [Streptococcus sanguinis SK1 = NCTC 7863]|jgi:lipoprotein transporter, putative|uniref:Lipoprotein n=2 Tax=Streptococcus sanguinis TaxID=1305 RepID=F0IRB9_STRSA|nr:MetQ/NlpA family ABC transporter substrate-binding protein [Streptococcus sanguinis]EGC26141.1 NLPA lipoprotein [Streptococcus sanguinis SK678]EGD39816.1 ABC superfamily ATP binding cassette transporter, binding protein [Streptococcus sanguinis SK160]EGF05792.1 ABC superfamily ATP binding cassette transporter, binding protein [Streptococcus sanguinis SK1 = NCTC 7863]EGF18280.1 ABC superfamily ATP binding cassette transporter, binding protein [Streptococcus sanguinis SK408]EGF22426.1 ABC sup
MMNLKKIFSVGLVGLAALGLAACGGSSSKENKSADGPVTVKVGVMSLSDTEEARWNKVQEILDKENAGVKLEYTQFTDYSQPNQALLDGDVDINAFQHYNFLENWNKEKGADLVSVADTYIAPIRLYSGTKDGKNKYTDVKDIPENGTIAVPNDATNESRALYLLESAGLIKLDVKGKELATVANIKENKKNLTISELDASQTPASLTSADAAVVNNTFVREAGIDYKKALFKEEANENSKQWYNLIAAKPDWKKSDKADAIEKIIKAYHTDEVKKVIEESSDGMDQPVW